MNVICTIIKLSSNGLFTNTTTRHLFCNSKGLSLNKNEVYGVISRLQSQTSQSALNKLHKSSCSRLPNSLKNFRCLHATTIRFSGSNDKHQKFRTNESTSQKNTDMVYYIISFVIFMVGLTYASVPLYKIYCQVAGIGGDPTAGHRTDLITTMKPVRDRPIRIIFQADKHSYMNWKFTPEQNVIEVLPGETALAFYSAENPTDETIIGVATYNVLPYAAGVYFNKIQCFCFEQQWLNPHEKVELPVFFYIDPEFDNDPELGHVDEVVLSYTFFKAQEGIKIPLPGFMRTDKPTAQIA